MDPGNPRIIAGMLRCLIQIKRFDDAIEMFDSFDEEILKDENIVKIKKLLDTTSRGKNNLVDENKKNINLENKNQPFPQFNLNVNNPISWKLMLLIMLMQLMTNIMLVVVLYLK